MIVCSLAQIRCATKGSIIIPSAFAKVQVRWDSGVVVASLSYTSPLWHRPDED